MTFTEYCLKNQYSTNQTRSQAFTMGSASRQSEIDELQKRIDELTAINDSLVAYKNQLLDELEGETNE